MSNESRRDIARGMLLTAPPGQLEGLVQDFETIFAASGETLEEEWVKQVRAEHGSTRADLAAADSPRAKDLYENVKAYQSEYYSSNGVVSALSVAEEGTDLIVRTYSERIDESNCHAGSWTAHWKLQSSGELQGTVKVQALCHEEGNIHLHSTSDFGPVSCGEEDAVQKIGDCEQQVTDSINEMYDDMGEKLRSLRRAMPVTRTKMDWNVLSHRMVKLLGDTKE